MDQANGLPSGGSGAPGVLAAARWEWFRLSRRVAFWVIAGLAAAGVAATLVVLLLVAKLGDFPISPYEYLSAVVSLLSVVGPFLGVILASIIFGGDFGWGTWRTLAARGIPRWQIGLAKLLLPSAALAVLWVAAWALGTMVALGAGSRELSTGSGGWREPTVQLGAAWLVALAYLGLGAVLTTAGRSTVFGLAFGVGIILFELAVYPLADLAGEVFDIPLDDYTRWTLRGVTSRLVNGADDFSRWAFLAPALGYGALCWGLTLFDLGRRDLSSHSG